MSTGEWGWYILLVQFLGVTIRYADKKATDGYAWDFAYVKARSQEEAVKLFREGGDRRCNLKACSINPKTEVIVHRCELLDDSMDRCDVTPKRTRAKR